MASDGLPRARTEDAPLLETVAPLTFNTERASWQRKDYVQDQKRHPQAPHFPDPTWARALKKEVCLTGREKFPQTIAHRGYKARYPENTMSAFKGAVEAGAHALETDIHLSKDGVVVLSHDPSLKRCYGEKKRIIDCDWEYLSKVRNVEAPHESMPRLVDLLSYLSQPEQEDIWVLLDIKVGNVPDDVMRLIAEAISSVPPGRKQWKDKIVLGCWAGNYLPLCNTYLPGFPITIISFSITYSRQFLRVPNVSFNTFQKVLMGPLGIGFLSEVKEAHKPIFAWTVNKPILMRWCVRNNLDGVVTDDPAKFKEVCDRWEDDDEVHETLGFLQLLQLYWLALVVTMLGPLFRRRFPATGVESFVVKSPQKQKTW